MNDAQHTLTLSDSGSQDFVAILRKNLEEAADNLVIRLPTNTYHLTDEDLAKQFLHISNNDSGLKAVAFHIRHRHGLTIDGQGSTLLVQGKIIPFLIENSQDITLKHFILDWVSDYHAELQVEQSDSDGTVFRVLNNCAVMFMDGRVYFDDYPDNLSAERYHLHLLEYDPQRLTPAEKANDFFLNIAYRMEPVSAGAFRVNGLSGDTFQPGRLFIATNHVRPAPGIVVSDSSRVNIEDVTIHYAPGMAILAQRSADVGLQRVTVKRNAPRRISALADASHFVMCKGHIHLSECNFSGQLDDATNIHGIYGVIHKILDDHTLVIALQHYQQLGILLGDPGDTVRFLRFPEHLTLGSNQIKHIRCINERYQHIVFADPIPSSLVVGDILENLTLCPSLTIEKCNFVDNRARGILITTPEKVLVTQTTFSNPGSAIRISGDATDWFESGATNHIEIVGNEFQNCNYGSSVWGSATIDVYPAFDMPAGHLYHQSVVIHDNQFKTFHDRLLKAKNVRRIEFMNNAILRSDSQAIRKLERDYCILDNVDERIISGNTEVLAEKS
jgi:hypothetical protein